MAVFPGAIASFAGFTATHTLADDDHAAQHNSEQAEIIAAQTKIGESGSLDVNSLDYKINHLTKNSVGLANVDNTSDSTKQLIYLSAAYPIGTLYINATDVTNPATLLGFGSWAYFGAGRVLVSFDSTQVEFDTAEKTGGEKNHTLTTAEIPAHTHTLPSTRAGILYAGGGGAASLDSTVGATGTDSGSTGGGGSHNNLQPHIVVYMWKRTA